MLKCYKYLIVFMVFAILHMHLAMFRLYTYSNLKAESVSVKRVQPSLLNRRLPDLLGGPESKIRTPMHNPALHNVFYTGPKVKQVALTFDDGPDERFTPQILDILKKNNIKATFFIMGSRAEAYPQMVKRILRDGHVIGNHTWDHPNISKLPPDKIKNEINRTNALLYKLTGYRPALFRPPYGATTARVVRQVDLMGFNIIDWSVDTRDWAGTPTPTILKFVKKEIHPGAIVLQHCAGGRGENLENTVKALPEIISYLKQQSYTFTTIQKLLNLPVSQ